MYVHCKTHHELSNACLINFMFMRFFLNLPFLEKKRKRTKTRTIEIILKKEHNVCISMLLQT